jgi:CheY-like chemotaxis protein
VHLEALIAETKSLLDASLPPDVDLIVRGTAGTTLISGEPAQLQQVILNVCNNAAQAMDDGGAVGMDTEVRDISAPLQLDQGRLPPGRYAVISVADTGRGMDETTLERIFEPFFTTRPGGNGLGLATVREIVREHGGGMAVHSAPGVGTRFEIWLPCAPPAVSASGQRAPGTTLRGGGETVLVFEADRGRLLMHEEILAALGYEPVGFTQPDQARAACRAETSRFDAALVCYSHARASALDLASGLHRDAPNMPIVLAAAAAEEFGARSLAAAGISEIVRQPPGAAELAGALARCLPPRS